MLIRLPFFGVVFSFFSSTFLGSFLVSFSGDFFDGVFRFFSVFSVFLGVFGLSRFFSGCFLSLSRRLTFRCLRGRSLRSRECRLSRDRRLSRERREYRPQNVKLAFRRAQRIWVFFPTFWSVRIRVVILATRPPKGDHQSNFGHLLRKVRNSISRVRFQSKI